MQVDSRCRDRRFRRALVLLLVLAAFTPALLLAQPTVPEAAVAAKPPASLENPRAAMRTFLTATVGGERETAVSVLDLSGLPARPGLAGAWELAVQLKDTIDRIRFVDYEEIPTDPESNSWVFADLDAGRIRLAAGADGAWRFDTATIDALPALWRATRGAGFAEGVQQVGLTPGLWLRSKLPKALTDSSFLLETWQWIGLFVLVFLGFVLDRLAAGLLAALARSQFRIRFAGAPTADLAPTLRPWGLVAAGFCWRLGLVWLALPPRVLSVLALAVEFFTISAFIWAVYRLVDLLSAVLEARAATTESRYDDLLVPLVRKSLKVFVAAFGLVFLADNLDIEISSLITGLGLGGLAFALAAQDLLKNLFGSLMVVLDRPFQVGDWVIIGDVEGSIEEVGFRSTRVRTFYNSLITVPNSNLISSSVDNMGARQYRRWSTRLSITYDTPVEAIEAFVDGIRELIERHPYTRKDYFHVYLNSFESAALDVLLYVFWLVPDWATELRERQRLMIDILRLARSLGVEFAFPTQTVYLRQEEWQQATEEAGEGDSERIIAARLRGRETARSLVEASLGERVPPPVASAVEESENRGSG